ncbi:hypothetical protein ACFW1A_29450 [Kitasatospora sp. NPDC058965]|uniref:hypothetical protein n=1 Tax=Kitasatospora sp. NPDC058965 TaxID=3346682 RepID=UPI0036C862C3
MSWSESESAGSGAERSWFGVRTFYRWTPWEGEPYEERITLWQAAGTDAAMALGEREAARYAEEGGFEVLPLTQVFATDGPPGHGSEVFSLLHHRTGQDQDAFLDRFDSPRGAVAVPEPE